MKTQLVAEWLDFDGRSIRNRPGEWCFMTTDDKLGAQAIQGILTVDAGFRLDSLDGITQDLRDAIAGKVGPGSITGGECNVIRYGNGHFLVTATYVENWEAVLTANELLATMQKFRDLLTHPGLHDPNAHIEPAEIELIDSGPTAHATYLELGGSVASAYRDNDGNRYWEDPPAR